MRNFTKDIGIFGIMYTFVLAGILIIYARLAGDNHTPLLDQIGILLSGVTLAFAIATACIWIVIGIFEIYKLFKK